MSLTQSILLSLATNNVKIPTRTGNANYLLTNNGNDLIWIINSASILDYDNSALTNYITTTLQEFVVDTDAFITSLLSTTSTNASNLTNHINSNTAHRVVERITSDTVFTIGNTTTNLIVDYGSIEATATITMPESPVNNQHLSLCSGTNGITSLTLSPNTGQTLLSPITSLLEGEFASYIYQTSTSTWYRT